jgi:hypothetical protein
MKEISFRRFYFDTRKDFWESRGHQVRCSVVRKHFSSKLMKYTVQILVAVLLLATFNQLATTFAQPIAFGC